MYLSYIFLATILHNQVLVQSSVVPIACNGLNILLPESDLNKTVDFLLWTRKNPIDYYKVKAFDKASLDSSNFNGSLATFVMFHGYTDNGTKPWIYEAKTKLLAFVDANVFSVNYSALVSSPTSTPIDYLPAVCRAYQVGNYTAYVFNWIHQNSALVGDLLYLIGHSLGAHVAGIMGHYLKSLPIGIALRITGLDPAGPLFTPPLINDFKLEKDQAKHVDVIHTNGCVGVPESECNGIVESIGKVDFYPNGGRKQPGCDPSDGLCSHQRVTALFIESIPPNNKTFTSWPCERYAKFNNSKCPDCGQGCLNMGYPALTDLEGDYFLNTNAESPYAKGNVQK